MKDKALEDNEGPSTRIVLCKDSRDAEMAKPCCLPQGAPRHVYKFHAAKCEGPNRRSGEVLCSPGGGEVTPAWGRKGPGKSDGAKSTETGPCYS